MSPCKTDVHVCIIEVCYILIHNHLWLKYVINLYTNTHGWSMLSTYTQTPMMVEVCYQLFLKHPAEPHHSDIDMVSKIAGNSTVCSAACSSKALHYWPFVRGIHQSLMGSPHKGPVMRKVFISLWPSDAIWRQRSVLTLAQVMACCLTAPSHYLNQCWLIISEVQWHSY